MPARRAPAPRAVPLHLAALAFGRLAPDREIGGVALAFHRLDTALSLVGRGARQAAIVGHACDIEIKARGQLVAVLVRDAFRKFDHLRHIVGGDRPVRGLADIERGDIGPIGFGIMARDVPDRPGGGPGRLFQLVLARIGIIGKVADIGDVDHMGEFVALERERAAQHVGKDIGAHVADVGVVVDRRPARIDPRLARMHRHERLGPSGQAVEQGQRRGVWLHGRMLCQPARGQVKGGAAADAPRRVRIRTRRSARCRRPVRARARSCSPGHRDRDSRWRCRRRRCAFHRTRRGNP